MENARARFYVRLSLSSVAAGLLFFAANACGESDQPQASLAPDGAGGFLEAGPPRDDGNALADAPSESATVDPICVEAAGRAEASGCPEQMPLDKCVAITSCGTMQPALLHAVYRCVLDKPDICDGPTIERCMSEIAESRTMAPEYAAYNSRCMARYRECVDAGLPADRDPCGPPGGDDDILIRFVRDDVYPQLMKCFDGPCDRNAPGVCVFNGIGCWGRK